MERQVEEIDLLPCRFSGSLFCQAHVLIQIAILNRELSQGDSQPRVQMPRRLNRFGLGCFIMEGHGSHQQQ